jgi:hypothetical protein
VLDRNSQERRDALLIQSSSMARTAAVALTACAVITLALAAGSGVASRQADRRCHKAGLVARTAIATEETA